MDTLGGSRFFDKRPREEVAVTACKGSVSIHSILNGPIRFRAHAARQKGIRGAYDPPTRSIRRVSPQPHEPHFLKAGKSVMVVVPSLFPKGPIGISIGQNSRYSVLVLGKILFVFVKRYAKLSRS